MDTSSGNTVATETGSKTKDAIATNNLNTARGFVNVMNAVISDLATGNISSHAASAISKTGRNVLTLVGLQLKYGGPKNVTGDVFRVID